MLANGYASRLAREPPPSGFLHRLLQRIANLLPTILPARTGSPFRPETNAARDRARRPYEEARQAARGRPRRQTARPALPASLRHRRQSTIRREKWRGRQDQSGFGY